MLMKKNKNIVKAINKNVRSSPRKINVLLKNIRGKKVDMVIRDLSFARQRIASEIKKTVQSAMANAENNNQYDIDNLYVKEAYVGKSIVLKRFRARAKGKASGIKKPYANLTIILSENTNKKEELHGTKS
jgi:large subunit ribosomal protein L22